MFAALPMYDRPENAAAHDALWALIRDGLRAEGLAAPDALDREVAHDQGWGRPDLVLGQICNLPLRAVHRGKVTVIGASDYGLSGTEPGFYHSVMVARPEGVGAARLAYNDEMSNSGWDAVQAWVRSQGFPLRPVLATGSHRASLQAVASGHADLAGIDAHTWRMLQLWEPNAGAVEVIGRTAATPGMTFITRPGQDPTPYRRAIAAAIAQLPEEPREILGLRALVVLPESAYDLPIPPAPASFLG
jgi:ABC-type phosphate/phosphonate transport system substrate-binding protein